MPAVGSGRSAQRSRSALATAGLYAEELLLDDVGDLADATLDRPAAPSNMGVSMGW